MRTPIVLQKLTAPFPPNMYSSAVEANTPSTILSTVHLLKYSPIQEKSFFTPHSNRCIYKSRYSQNASIGLLLVDLVNHIFDEDTEVLHSMVVNNVTHVRNQNGLLNSVLKIHQEPENIKRPLSIHLNKMGEDFAAEMYDQSLVLN